MSVNKLMHMHDLLNFVKQEFQYSVRLQLFDNQMNSSN